MAVGRRRQLVQQAELVWCERGASAVEQFIQTGSFGEAGGAVLPYDPETIRALVASGKMI